MNPLASTFAALGVRDFRFLWSGTVLSTTAFMTTFLLVPIVGFKITGSYLLGSLPQMGSGITMLTLGLVGGVIADRYRKKPLVLAGQIFPCLLIIATGLLILTGSITIPLLFASTFLMGFGFALMGPARQAWIGELVPERLLANGVALQQLAQNIARVLGPTIAAIAALWIDAGWLYLLVAAFFLVVVPLTTLLPNTAPRLAPGPRRSVAADLAGGLDYLRRNVRLRILWLFWMVMTVCTFSVNSLMGGILRLEFGRDELDAMPFFAVLGVAALLVSITMAGPLGGRRAWQLMLASGIVAALGFWIVSIAPGFGSLLAAGVIAGIGTAAVTLSNLVLMMTNSKPEYFGRVMSFVMVGYGAQSLMAPAWGALADWLGGRETIALVGAVCLAATALMTLAWLRTRAKPMEPGTAAAALEESQTPAPRPAAGSPPPAPAFVQLAAPVVLMEGQKPPVWR